ncbi:T9SS type A sorting domain-containing protein [candidate division WOR-3 bacterium]|uniref:T9SS type A sorting domain-containing protein n=1 Tax=candidate division WOR-3 bacterium TaxID=2052148 RepID=A0A9D5QEY8_UNCW3|nr:T9SS type A sorting domain-containing protein [candidate division WOR-3 bacterium]MBD3365475.1 T9SS type A sorting domain-containing protein [candidate division WOR-3 bacterium]
MSFSVLNMILFAGVLVQPFRVAEAEPGHHQGSLRAEMASDGRFAVAWLDSLGLEENEDSNSLFIRFFEKDGTSLTEPYRVEKTDDTVGIYYPCIEMDSSGNTYLAWVDNRTQSSEKLSHLRYQRFDRDGNPLGPAKTLVDDVYLYHSKRPIDMSVAGNGDFVIVWDQKLLIYYTCIRIQRFDAEGNPKGEPFFPHADDFGEERVNFHVPQVALADNGDLVATWIDFLTSSDDYVLPKFQVFDADNEPILPWEPMGHRPDHGDTFYHNASRVKPFWLDEGRFVLFWPDYLMGRATSDLMGRMFSDRGLTPHYLCDHLIPDDKWNSLQDLSGRYSIDVDPYIPEVDDAEFVFAYTRSYHYSHDISFKWKHQVGLLGDIFSYTNQVVRRTYSFEFTPPWGADTVGGRWFRQPPAVAVCSSRIVWTYSRLNTDTILEAWAMISDWDMPDENMIEEESLVNPSPIKLSSTLNRLSYEAPEEAILILYNSAGRRVAVDVIHGKGEWKPTGISSGVYFARIVAETDNAVSKLVVLR